MVPQSVLDRIQPGDSIKLPHTNCSESKAMKVTHTEDGYHAHCFKCDEHRFIAHADVSFEARKLRSSQIEARRKLQAEKSYDLPVDFSHTIASSGLAWLGKGGWTLSLIKEHGIGWSDRLGMVILPVYTQGSYQGYVARNPETGGVKYIECCTPGTYWGSLQDTVVLTEDILSAGRINQVVPTVAILGTTIGPQLKQGLHKHTTKVITWFDSDPAGYRAFANLSDWLDWFPDISLYKIYTKRDPKHYTSEGIRECLKSIGYCSK